ncbi:protein phosphatase 2C domain-containing protein [Actinoplanes awajinensis]|uniref:PPM-type phosphatase domain-containing protein n=1 Tax=Actinoplanes awajinensis subsp. mycoplanecinus TaxID=135947 RepID=A0A101J820_9ACTN|nr:protein phosphatase 2C domain-containing protein [Actinoplanes awajinensis]KUL21923.1 hypothetical protein ADL15_49510 [Actinoplanes awajinensis subsp. mycoplanecinus]
MTDEQGRPPPTEPPADRKRPLPETTADRKRPLPETTADRKRPLLETTDEPTLGYDEQGRPPPWTRHDNRRWVVGDPGRQPAIRARVPRMFRTPPPDIVIDGAEAGRLTFRATSVRGAGHQERGEPRQDAYAVRFTRDQRWLAGCVADGVSAAKRSHEAAAVICEIVAQSLIDHLVAYPPPPGASGWAAELPWSPTVTAANDAVTDLARPFLTKATTATTLTFEQVRAVMSATALAFAVETEPAPNGGHRAMLANLSGDSAAFLLTGGAWLPLTAVKNDGAAIFSSGVRSLPADVRVAPNAFYLFPGQVLLVMTDGLGDPFGSGAGSVADFLRTRWAAPPDPLAFAQQVAFLRKSFTDDRTAVVLWPAPPADRDTARKPGPHPDDQDTGPDADVRDTARQPGPDADE